MAVIVRIPTPLRRLSNGEEKVEVPEGSLESIIDSLEQSFSGIKGRLCDDRGELRTFVNIYIDGEDVRFLEGINTQVKSGAEISIVPAVAGGKN
ncbi:MAG: molybdopterin synthase sulfur carrier subunit [Chloroflexi bacterium]|mgnify:FL=1|nr:molybdopterin synthase sulfur carrier subunit [Chloroflexota bacterium]|tara:strand:- start:33907 stop:34188 length:282 start_codon:yes stop_codon:yes gene_type:complete